MARGLDQHRARVAAVAALGRGLARRAQNRCELCGERTSLKVIEVPPLPEEPEEESAVMLCERCAALAASTQEPASPDALRFLGEAVWSEVLPVQRVAVRLSRRLSAAGVGWAVDVLDGLYLEPEIEAQI